MLPVIFTIFACIVWGPVSAVTLPSSSTRVSLASAATLHLLMATKPISLTPPGQLRPIALSLLRLL